MVMHVSHLIKYVRYVLIIFDVRMCMHKYRFPVGHKAAISMIR